MQTKNHLTVKQRKLIEGVVTGLPKRTAAIKAGYSKNSAHSIAHETLNNPEVLKALKIILDEQGLDDIYLASKLFELAEASINGQPNFTARARAIDMLLKVKGHYDKLHLQIDTTNDLTEDEILARITALSPKLVGYLQSCAFNTAEKESYEA